MTSTHARPVLEHALLPVIPGREPEFEVALAEALPIIRSMPGCLDASVSRCVERPSTYLLLVRWADLADHDPGFRSSPRYGRWKALLHRFYDPFPEVLHFGDLGEPADAVGR